MIATLLGLWTSGLLLAATILPQPKVAWLFWRFFVLVCLAATVALALVAARERPAIATDASPLWGGMSSQTIASGIAVLGAAVWLAVLLKSSGRPLTGVSGRIGPVIALGSSVYSTFGFATSAGVLGLAHASPTHALALFLAAAVVGFGTTAAMLGHAYLTAKAMPIDPLRRIVAAYGIAVAFQLLAGGAVCWTFFARFSSGRFDPFWIAVAIMYALVGLLAPLAFAIMAWQSVIVRNTQSTTGIMYFAMVTNFIGTLALCFLLRG